MILNITYGEITTTEVGRTDELTLTKFIRLAQLTIEYLLYSQDYYRTHISALDSQMNDMREKVNAL